MPAGTPDQSSAGDRSAPRHVYSAGIGPFASKAGDVSVKGPGVGVGLGEGGSAEVTAVSVAVAVGVADGNAGPDSPKACGEEAPPLEPLQAASAKVAPTATTVHARRRRADEAIMGARRG